jgi:hypothetical protein
MTGNSRLTKETMELLRGLQSKDIGAKAIDTTGISTSTGIQNYNLEPYAKTLYPVITPLRNKTPRLTTDNGGNAVHWKVITAINANRTFPGTSEGIRGAVIDITTGNRMASFVRFSLEESITEEAILQAGGFDNALAIGADSLLRSMFITEEEWMLVGNASGLPQPSAPSGTVGAGGAMTARDTYCKVVALTYDGWKRASLANGLVTTFGKSSALGESQTVNGGSSKMSAASAKATTAAGNLTVTWVAPAVPGAFAYAWFTGAAAAAGSCSLAGITQTNVFVQTADAAGGAQADNGAGYGCVTAATDVLGPAKDYSKNGSVYDGLFNQAINPNIIGPDGDCTATGYYKSLDGVALTADGYGHVNEIDNALEWWYDTYKITPTAIWTSSKGRRTIGQLTLSNGAGGTSPVYHINLENKQAAEGIVAGSMVRSYENQFAPYGNKELPIYVHPNLPAGCGKIFFECDEIPYPLGNIPGCYRMNCLRDYWQRLWPQTTETRYTSINTYGVLQSYVPFAMGAIDNALNV